MVSRIFKTAAATLAAISFASAASAGCGSSMYCGHSGHSSMPSLSSWSGASSYSSGSYTTTMSPIVADATYGTGSISETYTDTSSYSTYGFSGDTSSVAGLGYNESLQPTSCPVNVYGTSSGSTVLGCYNVVKPVQQTAYYRIVRPVIYVRYPVPVPVPYTSPCHTVKHYSRYGDHFAHHHNYRGCR